MEKAILEVRLYSKYMWGIHRLKRGVVVELGRISIYF